jgi:hypothetical protein
MGDSPGVLRSLDKYMALDRCGAELLFQVLTEREEKNSVAIASNESFGGNIIETGADSYRLARTRALTTT